MPRRFAIQPQDLIKCLVRGDGDLGDKIRKSELIGWTLAAVMFEQAAVKHVPGKAFALIERQQIVQSVVADLEGWRLWLNSFNFSMVAPCHPHFFDPFDKCVHISLDTDEVFCR